MTYFSYNNFSSSNYAFVAFLENRKSTNFCNASNQQHRCELRSHLPPAALVASKTIAINFMRQKCNSSLFHHLSKMQIICALPFWSPMSKSSEEFSYSTTHCLCTTNLLLSPISSLFLMSSFAIYNSHSIPSNGFQMDITWITKKNFWAFLPQISRSFTTGRAHMMKLASFIMVFGTFTLRQILALDFSYFSRT